MAERAEPTVTRMRGTAGKGRGFDWRAYGLIIALVIIAAAFAIATEGTFLEPRNVAQLMRQGAILTVVAAGVAVLIIQREIDLSIGSALYLVAVAAGWAQTQWGFGTVEAVLVALVVGLLIGAWQGFWVSWFGMPSFVVTLSGLLAFRGLGFYWSNAATLAPMNRDFGRISEGFVDQTASVAIILVLFAAWSTGCFVAWRRRLARFGEEAAPAGRLVRQIVWAAIGAGLMLYVCLFRGIPMAVVVALSVVAILSFIAGGTVFGRQMYAIGGNREAAHLSGIAIRRNLFISFLIMGVIYAVAGVLSSARINAVAPSLGEFVELEAIAAAVIGGISLSGGIGTIPGALLGALLLVMVDNGMNLMNISSFIQQMLKGLLLGGAVLFDIMTRPSARRLH
jgi:D-xylose transport system permease protein